MPPRWVGEVIAAGAMVIGLVVGALVMRKQLPLSPRQGRRQSWVVLAGSAVACGFVALRLRRSSLPQHQVVVWISLGGLVLAGAGAVYQLLRSPGVHEELQNFAAEPGRCGRCEYDLTGNVSGVCPECGWVIPRGPLDVDSPGWPLWWRRWRIDHLRRWRRTLVAMAAFALLFAGAALFCGLYFRQLSTAVPMALMSANFMVNAGRVATYGRAHRA